MTSHFGTLLGRRSWGSIEFSGKQTTYPSPKSTLTLISHLGQNRDLGEGKVVSQPVIDSAIWP